MFVFDQLMFSDPFLFYSRHSVGSGMLSRNIVLGYIAEVIRSIKSLLEGFTSFMLTRYSCDRFPILNASDALIKLELWIPGSIVFAVGRGSMLDACYMSIAVATLPFFKFCLRNTSSEILLQDPTRFFVMFMAGKYI